MGTLGQVPANGRASLRKVHRALKNWTTVNSFGQNNQSRINTVHSLALMDDVRAIPGVLNWATGDQVPFIWSLFGNVNPRLPILNMGKQKQE